MHKSTTLKRRKSFILLFSHHLLCSDKLKCFKLKGPFSRALFYGQHHLSKLTRQMEPFAIALDSFYVSVWERAHRRHLERGGPFKLNLKGDWMNHLSIPFKAGPTDARGDK